MNLLEKCKVVGLMCWIWKCCWMTLWYAGAHSSSNFMLEMDLYSTRSIGNGYLVKSRYGGGLMTIYTRDMEVFMDLRLGDEMVKCTYFPGRNMLYYKGSFGDIYGIETRGIYGMMLDYAIGKLIGDAYVTR